MAKVDLKGVYKVSAKGKSYYYAWRGPGAPRLYAEPGTPAFIEELQAALDSRTAAHDGSRIASLCTRYKSSSDWTGLAEKTRTNWRPWLDRIQIEFGQMRIASFGRPVARLVIRKWRDRYRATPRSADVALQVMSRLMSFAVAEGQLSINPVPGIPHLYKANRADKIWTDAELALLAQHASPEIMQAAKLAALTGLRQSDLLRLAWSHIGPLSIEIATGKSRQRKTTLIPLYGALKAHLATIPRRATTVLTNTDGVPWKTGFGSSWNKAITKAEIDLHFHDLRGTACTKLYIANMTPREIAEIMTWSEAEVERLLNMYVRKDDLLRDRIRRLDENDARTQHAKPTAKPPRKAT